MNIQSGAKVMALAAVLVLALVVPNVAEAQPPAGRKLGKIPAATTEVARRALAQFELANVNRDVQNLLALMQRIVYTRVLNRDVLLDSNSGHREVGRIPLRESSFLPSPSSSTAPSMGPFFFFPMPSGTSSLIPGLDR